MYPGMVEIRGGEVRVKAALGIKDTAAILAVPVVLNGMLVQPFLRLEYLSGSIMKFSVMYRIEQRWYAPCCTSRKIHAHDTHHVSSAPPRHRSVRHKVDSSDGANYRRSVELKPISS